MTTKKFLVGMSCAAFVLQTSAYEVPTHVRLSRASADNSVLADTATLERLGLTGTLTSAVQTFPHYPSDDLLFWPKDKTIRELIEFGAAYEDERAKTQALFHFFNPVDGSPLTVSGLAPGAPSPTWALEDKSDFGGAQPFSYKRARGYFFSALTSSSAKERKRSWGKTFQSIGHVIHHLQDMAQPQHVRNDPHCDAWIPCLVPLSLLGGYSPSLYEHWTMDHRPPDALEKPEVYQPVYSKTETSVFTTPRKFWSTSVTNGTSGAGIAEYTSRGFFSAGTLPGQGAYFPAPTLDGTSYQVNIATICAEAAAAGKEACTGGLAGWLSFYGSQVNDTLRPASSRPNARALSHSLFDNELSKRNWSLVYSLNRFNIEAAHDFLIPRAIAYSTGLINYFFRGKMEISLPPEGVYGIVDHTIENVKDTSGFRKIRLRVKNVTPRGSGIEEMKAPGKLRLVAKFHRNTCYTPTLSGEYGAQGIDWKNCRSKSGGAFDADNSAEEIVLSEEVDVGADINSPTPETRTFNFPTPIPINATDLFLQIVYRGPLGDEPDAVAVATKDISEPNFLTFFDVHDQWYYAHYPYIWMEGQPTPYTWTQWCDQARAGGVLATQDECDRRLWPSIRKWQFSDSGAQLPNWAGTAVPMGEWANFNQQPAITPLVTMQAPVGSYSRVAILRDSPATNAAVMVDDWDAPQVHEFYWLGGTMPAATNQFDPVTKTLVPGQSWRPARGIFVSPEDAELIGTPTNVGPLTPKPSTIVFPMPDADGPGGGDD